MKRFILAFLAGLLLGLFSPIHQKLSSSVLNNLDNPNAIFEHINFYRLSLNQKPLIWSDSLCKLAEFRVGQIQNDFSHDGFTSIPSLVKFSTYCPTCAAISENIAQSFFNEQSLVSAWIKSPAHNKNLVLPFTHACVVIKNNSSVFISSY